MANILQEQKAKCLEEAMEHFKTEKKIKAFKKKEINLTVIFISFNLMLIIYNSMYYFIDADLRVLQLKIAYHAVILVGIYVSFWKLKRKIKQYHQKKYN